MVEAWYGSDHYGTERTHIQTELEEFPGDKLVFVRDSPQCDPLVDSIYNNSKIDTSKVVWAWDMDAANNRELMQYYPDRKAWLVNMDAELATFSPYIPPAR